MRYFENLPIVNYDSDDTEVMAKLRNIFYRLEIYNLEDEYTRIYRIDGDKRLDTISQELYGTPHYWWIIAIINNIQDIIFDLPLEEDLLHQVATDRTLAIYANLAVEGALTYRSTQVDELIAENDEKRFIKIVRAEYMGRVIAQILKSL